MVRPSLLVLALLASACQAPTAPPVVSELVIRFMPGTSPEAKAALRARAGATDVRDVMPDAERWRVAGDVPPDPAVKFVQPNYQRHLETPRRVAPRYGLLSNDPGYANQWNLALAHFPEAWALSTGQGVVVATVDSGVDPNHPDLKANLLPMIDEVVAMGQHDGFLGQSYDGRDSHGHGTHVAGIIAAVANNGIGITGAAPGVKLLPVKVTSAEGTADDAIIARGVVDAVDAGARVVNLSIGGAEPSPILLDVINYAFAKDVTLVIAAGNEGGDVDYPAAYKGVLAVGGVTADGKVASYSNFGDRLSLVAPGGGQPGHEEGPGVYATTPTYASYISTAEHVALQYDRLTGTSMAAPQVTAAVALLLAREPALTPAQVWTRLVASANRIGLLAFEPDSGYGMLDAAAALRRGSDDGH